MAINGEDWETLAKQFIRRRVMIPCIMSFFAGALLGSLAMGLYVAWVDLRDASDDW